MDNKIHQGIALSKTRQSRTPRRGSAPTIVSAETHSTAPRTGTVSICPKLSIEHFPKVVKGMLSKVAKESYKTKTHIDRAAFSKSADQTLSTNG